MEKQTEIDSITDSRFMQSDITTYSILNLPTDSLMLDKEILSAGRLIKVVSSPVNLSIKLHDSNRDTIPLERNGVIRDTKGFTKFFVSTTQVVASGSIKLMISHSLSFDSFGQTTLASNMLHKSLVCTLAGTEYSLSITDNTKQLIFINNNIDCNFSVSFVTTQSINGFSVPPLSHSVFDKLDTLGNSVYIQSNVAGKTFHLEELF